jgi:antitoxin FitA
MMPTALTLKNIPDEVYDRLKISAEKHRRSLNSEAIACLEAVLLPEQLPVAERLARARALRSTMPKATCRARDIQTFSVAVAVDLEARRVAFPPLAERRSRRVRRHTCELLV